MVKGISQMGWRDRESHDAESLLASKSVSLVQYNRVTFILGK